MVALLPELMAAAVLLVAPAASAVPEIEPNDSIAAAQSLDGLFHLSPDIQVEEASGANTSQELPHAEVNSLGDLSGTLDYYSFTVPAGGRIVADLDCGGSTSDSGCEPYSGGMDPYLALYDPSGASFASNDDAGGDTGSESAPLDSFLEVVAPVGGVWTVAVGQYPALAPIAPGEEYILHVSVGDPVADIEPNDSIAAAQSLDGLFDLSPNAQVEDIYDVNTSNVLLHAEVNSLGDLSGTLDYYSFTVPAGGRIVADLDCGGNPSGSDTGCGAYTGGMDSYLALYDPSGAPFASNDDAGGDTGSESAPLDSFLEIVAPVGGVWTVAVGQYPALAPIAPGEEYILHVSVGGPVTDIEPNDSIPAAQSLDGLFDLSFHVQVQDASGALTSAALSHAEISSIGDSSGTLDYYSFTVPAGFRIILDLDCGGNPSGSDTGCGAYTGGMDSYLALYDPSGAPFASNDDAGGDTGSESAPLDSFLEIVAPVGGVWTVAVGQYPALAPIAPGEEYILHVSIGGVADTEPNDSIAAAQSLDGLFNLSFDVQVEDSSGVNTSPTLSHAKVVSLNDSSGTLDYYSFTVPAGSRIIADIDCGEDKLGSQTLVTDTGCGAYESHMDSYIDLYDPSGALFASNDDASGDTGSDYSDLDSLLEVVAPVDGVWTLAVGEFPPLSPIGAGEEYVLHVSLPEPSAPVGLLCGVVALALLRSRKRRRTSRFEPRALSSADGMSQSERLI